MNGPLDELTLTANAQPAILLVSYATFLACKQNHNLNIACATGHSLGEYSALLAAGAISFEDAIVLVHKRGIYMQEAVPPEQGKMVAVLGKDLEEIEEVLKNCPDCAVDIANHNAPGQIVLSGSSSDMTKIIAELGKGKYIPLPVSAPFHSRLMRPAAERLTADIHALTIKSPRFPIIANVTATPISSPSEIASLLIKQVCGRVRWVECIQAARSLASPDSIVIEFGAGNVLAGLCKRIDKELQIFTTGSAEEIGRLYQ
jgi:[acyl-carrier-protein] S-malonyltransferase